MPPLLMVVAPTAPVPASVAPLFTVTAELEIEPFTTSVPALIVVPPVYVLVPDSVRDPLPSLISDPPVPPEFPPSSMIPLTSVLRLLPPTLNDFEPR